MKKPRIAVVGSLNMDLVLTMDRLPRTGETLQGEAIHYISGGKGANQAVACARLGAESVMIGKVGDDPFGKQIAERMNGFGVDASGLAAAAGTPTGTATILHTRDDNSIVIVPGANGRCDAEFVERHADAIRGADVLMVQLEVPLPAVERALRIAREAGVRTVLNPAPAAALPDELIRLADFFTPNETEFEFFSGAVSSSEDELFERMREWRSRFGCTLVVTRGGDGISCLGEGGLISVPALKVTPVDTTGAGDCFNASLAYGIASGWELRQSLEFAVKAASLSVQKFGAQDGMPTIDEVLAG